ncbi:hypothetical protein PCASD_02112 [Puccinia coronata f. sp. avenae]|uniref:Uncharacterized protein n=1 Tax=Puccinia coronata f. sp. avenae TaxID=200324 RepID=A0A2N5VPZ1_9BASI|nr:hypothetical protein PCASD_02112 [Puccinia coronata f. sp. avenae]
MPLVVELVEYESTLPVVMISRILTRQKVWRARGQQGTDQTVKLKADINDHHNSNVPLIATRKGTYGKQALGELGGGLARVEESSQLGGNILRLTPRGRDTTGKVSNGIIGEIRLLVTLVGFAGIRYRRGGWRGA